ncbi:protein NRT1/ PTR FAMILY 8.3-like [Humulus lupulus]|uniref:protein NRT1/ PTR FAMILY 8.3-like n=1 Tax=Humulus lupulus TaxID=3486 RepID=UPI002B405331|nr:protein NRT1/ PTR FAMILY 8.3-like [Humulus lupulus]
MAAGENYHNSLTSFGQCYVQNDSSGELYYTIDGSVDFYGEPALKQDTGKWRSCFFILGAECCERMAFYGVSSHLVDSITKKLDLQRVIAVQTVTIWQGTTYIVPLIGAILADSYIGRYWTIVAFSSIQFIGVCALIITGSIPTFEPTVCVERYCASTAVRQYTAILVGLSLIALGTGGVKPCVAVFGGDQFDEYDLRERRMKGSYFNWFYFATCVGIFVASFFIVRIQYTSAWSVGFLVPALSMGISIAFILSGTPFYRFHKPRQNPFTTMFQVLVASCRNWNLDVPEDSSLLYETQNGGFTIEEKFKLKHTDTLRFLDKAAVISNAELVNENLYNPWRLCTVNQVEQLKALINLFPIWATGITLHAARVQVSTLFVEQGMLMDTKIDSFSLNVDLLGVFEYTSGIILVPLYDKVIIPIVRRFTGNEKGFSKLQQIGIGHFISVLSMVAAAIVETIRLNIAKELGLVYHDKNAIPLNILWQLPQYILFGISMVFSYPAQLEFFYDESPVALRSLCNAFLMLSFGFGYYMTSSFLHIVKYCTSKGDKIGWLPKNLNEGHLDYVFWTSAGISFLNMLIFIIYAMKFKQRKAL